MKISQTISFDHEDVRNDITYLLLKPLVSEYYKREKMVMMMSSSTQHQGPPDDTMKLKSIVPHGWRQQVEENAVIFIT